MSKKMHRKDIETILERLTSFSPRIVQKRMMLSKLDNFGDAMTTDLVDVLDGVGTG
jgi:hypothetical protein